MFDYILYDPEYWQKYYWFIAIQFFVYGVFSMIGIVTLSSLTHMVLNNDILKGVSIKRTAKLIACNYAIFAVQIIIWVIFIVISRSI